MKKLLRNLGFYFPNQWTQSKVFDLLEVIPNDSTGFLENKIRFSVSILNTLSILVFTFCMF